MISGLSRKRGILGALVAAGALAGAPSAGALQFTPASGDRLNTFASGDPGSPFNTADGGVDYDGVGSSDPHPGDVVVTGQIPSLFLDDGSQETFTGAGEQPIDFVLEATLTSLAVDTSDPDEHLLIAEFAGTSDGQPDLVLTDPLDGDAVLLESNLVGGFLDPDGAGPQPAQNLAPLTAIVPFDPDNVPEQPNGQAVAIFQNEANGNPWEVLFSDGVGTLNDEGLAQTLISNWNPTFDLIEQAVASSGDLPSLDAEANGFIFRLEGSQFVIPEPGTAALLAGGLAALGATRRRGAARRRAGPRVAPRRMG